MAKVRHLGSLLSLDASDGVERPGPGQAPTAFRIWRAGPNVCKWTGSEPETFQFSERSAEALEKEQAARGMLYMFDVNHRSLSAVTNEDGEAAGWHRLEIRKDADGKPECWAVNCEWDPEIKAGIESKPPKWRYFSPVWDVDPETNEIVSYTNCAVTNNPATRNIPSLAASLRSTKSLNKGEIMNKEEAQKALASLVSDAMSDDQKKCVEALAAFIDQDSKDSEPASEDENKAEASEDDSDKKDEDGEEKKATADGEPMTLAALKAELDEMRKEAILDKAGITGPKRASLMTKPLDVIREALNISAGLTPRGTRPATPARDENAPDADPVVAMIKSAGSGSKNNKKVQ